MFYVLNNFFTQIYTLLKTEAVTSLMSNEKDRVLDWSKVKYGECMLGSGINGIRDSLKQKGGMEGRVNMIAGAIAGALRIPGITGGSIGGTIKNLEMKLPNAAGGTTVRTDTKAIGAMQSSFGGIASSMGVAGGADIYKGIVDELSSDVNNMSNSFGKKHRILTDILVEANLILKEIENSRNRIDRKISDGPNSGYVRQELEMLNDLEKLLRKDIEKISTIIDSAISEATRQISSAATNIEEIKTKLMKTTGTDGISIGKKISYVTGAVPNYAKALEAADVAAKKIGVELGDIMDSRDKAALRMRIEEAKSKSSSVVIKDLVDFDRKITDAYMGKKAASTSGGGTKGGVISMEKRIESQTVTRKGLLKAFSEKSNILFKRMLVAVYAMSKKLGTTIPLSDELGVMIHTFDQMGSIYREGIEFALTGYNKHASATEQRERFLGQLAAVISSLKALVAGPGGDMFQAIKTPMEEFQKHIDFYIDRFNLDEGNKIQTRFKSTTGGDDDDEKYMAEGGSELSQAGMTLNNVRRTLKHFYAVAKMRSNLTKVVSESKVYNKNYESILGEALSKHIEVCNTDYDNFTKALAGTGVIYNGLSIGDVFNPVSIGNTEVKKNWNKENILKMKKTMVDAKIELYRALQSIDMRLMQFSDAAAASPDDVKEVSRMLDSVQIVSEWFNDRSGDSVAGLFEYMPFMLKGFDPIDSPHTERIISKEKSSLVLNEKHYYSEVEKMLKGDGVGGKLDPAIDLPAGGKKSTSAKGSLPGNPFIAISPTRAGYAKDFAKKTVDRIMALKNIVAAFTYLGNKFGGKNIDEGAFMTPGQLYSTLCNYLYTSAFVMGWDGYKESGGASTNAFSKTYKINGVTMESTAVANTINGGINDQKSNTNIGPVGDLPNGKTGINVGICSYSPAPFDNVDGNASMNGNLTKQGAGDAVGRGGETVNGIWAVTGNIVNNPATANPKIALKDITGAPPVTTAAFGCAFNSIPEMKEGGGTVGGWHGEFIDTDKLFIVAIKSMVAKVFTVSGLYNMFNFQSHGDHTMSSTRFVLGGSDSPASSNLNPSNLPEIIDEAIELYVRLPLLAEFYKDVFSLDVASTSDEVISLIPEMDPIWSGIMRIAFDSPKGAGVVTKNYAARMIKEINGIYARYAGKPNLVSSVVNDFIADVNSRFGVMKRVEAQKYINEENSRREQFTDSKNDPRDFDILDDNETGTGIAPSDRYGVGVRGSRMNSSNTDFSLTFINTIKEFREKVDNKIRHAVYGSGLDGSITDEEMTGRQTKIPNFYEQVRIAKNTMKTTKTPEEKFGVVYAAISGLESSVTRASETYVLFHELVVAPLNTLAMVYSALDKFEQIVWTNCIATAARETISITDAVFTAIINPATILTTLGNILNKIKAVIPQNLKENLTLTSLFRPEEYSAPAGYYGIGASYPDIKMLTNRLQVSEDGKKTFAFISLWHEKCFKQLTQAILSHATDMSGLVEVSTSGSKITIDHSRLQQYCEETMTFIRKSILSFRGVIDSTILEKYEAFGHEGSIAYLQEHLFDRMFYGKDDGGLPKAIKEIVDCYYIFGNKDPTSPGRPYFTRDLNLMQVDAGIAPNTAVVYNTANNWNTTARGTVATQIGIGNVITGFKGWSFDSVMSELVYYYPINGAMFSGTAPNSALAYGTVRGAITYGEESGQSSNTFISTLKHCRTDKDTLSYALKSPGSASNGTRLFKYAVITGRYNFYLQKDEKQFIRGDHHDQKYINHINGTGLNAVIQDHDCGAGLLIKFNEVLAKYLEQFWDPGSSKIYKPAISEFANGSANRAVFQNMGFPDFAAPILLNEGESEFVGDFTISAGGAPNITDVNPIATYDALTNRKIARIGGFIRYEALTTELKFAGPVIRDDLYITSSWATRLGTLVKYFRNAVISNKTLRGLYDLHFQNNIINDIIVDTAVHPVQNITISNINSVNYNKALRLYLHTLTPILIANIHGASRAAARTIAQVIAAIAGAAAAAPLRNACAPLFIENIDIFNVLIPNPPGAGGNNISNELLTFINSSVVSVENNNLFNTAINGVVANVAMNSLEQNMTDMQTIIDTANAAALAAGGAPRAILAGEQELINLGASLVQSETDQTALYTKCDNIRPLDYQDSPWNGKINAGVGVAGFGNNEDTLSNNILKMWCIKACLRFRNKVVEAMGTNPIFSESDMKRTIEDLAGEIIATEKTFHIARLNRVVTLSRLISADIIRLAAKGDDGTVVYGGPPLALVPAVPPIFKTNIIGNPLSNMFTDANLISYNNNNSGIILNLAIGITDIVSKHISRYSAKLISEISKGPASVVVAAMYNMDMYGNDLRLIYDSANAPFNNVILGANYDPARYSTCMNKLTYMTFLGLNEMQINTMYNVQPPPIGGGAPPPINLEKALLMGATDRDMTVATSIARFLSYAFGMGIMEKTNAIGNNFTEVINCTENIIVDTAGMRAALVPMAGGGTGGYIVNCEFYTYTALGYNNNINIIPTGPGGNIAPFDTAAGKNAVNTYIDGIITSIDKAITLRQKLISTDPEKFNAITSLIGDDVEKKLGNPDEIVFASLANVMKNMLTEQSRSGTAPALLWTNLSDVPSGMKENFKANLPIFIKMFSKIGMSANLLKMLLRSNGGAGNINVNRFLGGVNNINKKTKLEGIQGQLWPYDKNHEDKEMKDDVNARGYYNYLLDKLSVSCDGIIKCATTVLDELGDNPLYLETAEGSITSYRNNNNVAPFMPMSSALMGLRDNEHSYNTLKPFHLPSGSEFSLAYGTRLLLGRPSVKPMLDHAPGMRELTEKYNLVTSDAGKQFALETVDSFIGKYVPLLRWITDVKTISIVGCGHPLISSTKLNGYIKDELKSYGLKNTVNDVISLTTSSDKNGSIDKIVAVTTGTAYNSNNKPLSRSETQIYNIIDLGVNPININALRREVPLVNMLNYAYTFDSFAKDILGNFKISADDMEIDNPINGLLNFVIHPYASAKYYFDNGKPDEATTSMMYNVFGSIPANNSHGLAGHDKFAINQILCKALFSGYESFNDNNNAGIVVLPFKAQLYRNGQIAQANGSTILYYPEDKSIKEMTITHCSMSYLQMLGQMRFDTTFIRNLLFISTAHRLMRAKISNELMKISYPVATGPSVANPTITEGIPWETWDKSD
jgi:hypothetical protein